MGLVVLVADLLVDELLEEGVLAGGERLKFLGVVEDEGGGVVGVGELVGCVAYATGAKFEADRGRHLNAPEWWAAVHPEAR